MQTIHVNTGRPYDIHIGSGLLPKLSVLLNDLYPRRPRIAIVTDDCVDAFYGSEVKNALVRAGWQVCKFVFPNGERSKNLNTVSDLYAFLSENSITRTDLILALGGGVTGDLAGFAAASWLRGIDFVQIPTTFLAMIDSSVGGKTGVDIPQGKNLVGAFWQPTLVLCDIETLKTLPASVFADGVAEAIKYGAILDETLFALLESGELQNRLAEVIGRCVELKRLVVEQDERDRGQRQWLNFGHTFGHAIERESAFSVTHGQGVAIGMVLISQVCEHYHLTPAGTTARIAACCETYHLPTKTAYPLEALCVHCMGDKKRAGNSLSLVILNRIGEAALYPVETARLLRFMKEEDDG